MSKSYTELCEELRKFDQELPSNKFEKVGPVVWFHFYAYDEMLKNGLELTGYSARQRETTALLVVRAVIKGQPKVSFTTDRTTTSCIRVFKENWDADFINWSDDKFA